MTDKEIQDRFAAMEDTINKLRADLEAAQTDLAQAQSDARRRNILSKNQAVSSITQPIMDLVVLNSMVFGNDTMSYHMDRQGSWWGTKTLKEITDVTAPDPIPGTAILLDGTVYAKDGISGLFTEFGGGTLTFQNGICIAKTP